MSVDIQIVFQPDFGPAQLGNQGNSADNPISKAVPPMFFYDYTQGLPLNRTEQTGNTAVTAPMNGDVVIEIRASTANPTVTLGPVKLIAEWWHPVGGDKTLVTPALMNSDGESPLQTVALHAERRFPGGFTYSGAATNWTEWKHDGASVSRAGHVPNETRVHIPHVALITADNAGDLIYGLEYALVVGQQVQGYFSFSGAVLRIGGGS